MIGSGLLSSRVIATRQSATLDALGRKPDTWTRVGTFRCDVRDQGGAEEDWGRGAAVVRRFELRARWGTVQSIALTERDRLTLNGRTLRIDSITDLEEKHRVAVLQCVEVSP